jgi:hypothetical protein
VEASIEVDDDAVLSVASSVEFDSDRPRRRKRSVRDSDVSDVGEYQESEGVVDVTDGAAEAGDGAASEGSGIVDVADSEDEPRRRSESSREGTLDSPGLREGNEWF